MYIVRGKGSFLFDDLGKRYINFAESTNIFGHGDPELTTIMKDRIDSGLIHYPLTISYPEIAKTVVNKLEKIIGISGREIYSSSGSEACDIAFSVLSEFGPIITLEGGYHGNSGQFFNKAENDRIKYGFYFNLKFPEDDSFLEEIDKCIEKGASSLLIEPLQVEGGIREIPTSLIKKIRTRYPDLFICVDESYTGFSKTGRFFSYQWHDIVPDMIIMGKSIGGGLPLGLTLINNKISDKSEFVRNLRNNAFGSSSGNIMSLFLADNIISRTSSNSFIEEVKMKETIFKQALRANVRKKITGRGLILGILTDDKTTALQISNKLMDVGIFATIMRATVRLSPPLNIADELLINTAENINELI